MSVTARAGPGLAVTTEQSVECSTALILCDRSRSGAEDSRCKLARAVYMLLRSRVNLNFVTTNVSYRRMDAPSHERLAAADERAESSSLLVSEGPLTPIPPPSFSIVVPSSPAEESPRFLHADFAAAIRAALPADSVLGPLLAAARSHPSDPVMAAGAPRCTFVCRDGLLY